MTDGGAITDAIKRSQISKHIRGLISLIGEDPDREGLTETPERVTRAMAEWFSGYAAEKTFTLKKFEAPQRPGLVIVRDITFYSNCEHHMCPFFGTVTIMYIPNNYVAGLSKFPRLVDVFARRLQIQERLTNEIGEYLQRELDPEGLAVIIKARHMCVESRGISRQGSVTVTHCAYGTLLAPLGKDSRLVLAEL